MISRSSRPFKMSNKAAWTRSKGEKEFKIDDAPMPIPNDREVVIRNYALAINPADIAIRDMGVLMQKYPKVLGEDIAGVVFAVGSAVTRFKKGDRVLAMVSIGFETGGNDGAFQLYAKASEHFVCKIPDQVEFKDACVLPLCMCTASGALYAKDTLDFPYPQATAKPSGEVVVVWAGR